MNDLQRALDHMGAAIWVAHRLGFEALSLCGGPKEVGGRPDLLADLERAQLELLRLEKWNHDATTKAGATPT